MTSATVVPVPAAHPPGTITEPLTVASADGSLELYTVQPAGKKLMSWQDFVNGRHVKPGDRLESLSD